MKITIELLNARYAIDLFNNWSLAVPLIFDGEQPNHFGAPKAIAKPIQDGAFVGDVSQGGSCNVDAITLIPHCNGTHTESIAHICEQASTLDEVETPLLIPSALVSIEPELATNTEETYTPEYNIGDKVITQRALHRVLQTYDDEQLQGVIIRTLPNNQSKQYAQYNADNEPAFFTREAILYLNQRGVQHLITDLPSLDRMHDDGLLTCHHLFWQVTETAHLPNEFSLIQKTITELAYIDSLINDGFYFTNLKYPRFVTDAVPSNPVIYLAERIS